MDEVIPGILHWQAKHPKIGIDVSSHLLTDTGTALDPLLPEGEGPDWIGHDVKRTVLTVRHHLRSAPDLGVPVLAHRSGLHEFEGTDLEVEGYDAGDELAPGVHVLPFGRICPDDAVLHIAIGPGVLAFGDGILNYGASVTRPTSSSATTHRRSRPTSWRDWCRSSTRTSTCCCSRTARRSRRTARRRCGSSWSPPGLCDQRRTAGEPVQVETGIHAPGEEPAVTSTIAPPEHLDVLIVGAGLSGVGAGCQIQANCPGKSFAILEGRDAIGGTWDLFRYPGIRSDSDMYTLGYRFRPWKDAKSIADGPAILSYIRDTAQEHGVDRKIRFNHRVVSAEWSSDDAHWTVEVVRTDTGETLQLTCGFVFMCTGYYRYDEGYTPEFEGTERFAGPIIHPQHWPADLDYAGKRVVVIGSGATAVTLVPAMAERAEHVTMLQRSPSYVLSLPGQDPIARLLRRALPMRVVYPIVRWKNVLLTMAFFQLSRRRPRFIKGLIRKGVERRLPAGYDVDTHFRPRYNPWDQRMCLVPDGDLFEAVCAGDASIVTDRIKTFTEKGLELESGAQLETDVIVTATGLNLVPLGGMQLVVDGRQIDVADTVGYKGMMFSGVPNLAVALGYTNASWTLKCDLTCEYVCRLLNHMDEHGYAQCMPLEPDPSEPRHPMIDFNSGYVVRSIHKFPKQGDRQPWRLHQNYARDILMLRRGELEDEGIEFSRAGLARDTAERVAA